jgi:aspartate carbamoyltransferase catalytic subunit
MRHLLDTTDLTLAEIDEMMALACDIIDNPDKYATACARKKLATLFFEPSTRTRLSFEAAMLELGGSVLGFSEAASSSAAKGETVADTARIISNYADIIAMRHPLEGAAFVASQKTLVPIINAGDGGHAHPTQTLTDLLTIHREKGRFDNLTIGLCGDLKFGRTVHSLIKAMSRYEGIRFVLISPEELAVPDYIISEVLDKSSAQYVEVRTMEEAMSELDILYMTRVQRERFASEEEYLKHKDAYILDLAKLTNAKSDLTIMHPLPRVNEIAAEVDDDSRAKYFEQALNGKYIRMALILTLLAKKDETAEKEKPVLREASACHNPHCISNFENLPHLAALTDKKGTLRCIYCESRIG